MTPLLLLATALAGGLGAVLRFLTDAAVTARAGGRHPWGTVVINVLGSFTLGLLTGLVLRGGLPEAWGTALGTGLLGGYTTFSTAMWELVALADRGRRGRAAAHAAGMLAAGLAAAWLGLAITGG